MPMPAHPTRRCRHPEPSAGAGAPPPGLDPQALQRLRELDPDGTRGFVLQVMRTYLASLERFLGTLGDARAQQNLKLAGDAAHTLKSSSAAVGATGLATACASLERLVRAGDGAALGAPLDDVMAEATRVMVSVRAMLPA